MEEGWRGWRRRLEKTLRWLYPAGVGSDVHNSWSRTVARVIDRDKSPAQMFERTVCGQRECIHLCCLAHFEQVFRLLLDIPLFCDKGTASRKYVTPSSCTHTSWKRDRVFGNDGAINLGTKIILQQVGHGRALLLYTLMPFEFPTSHGTRGRPFGTEYRNMDPKCQ